jgi:hypothetical protein
MLFLEFKLLITKMKTNRLELFRALMAAPFSIGVDVFLGVGFG